MSVEPQRSEAEPRSQDRDQAAKELVGFCSARPVGDDRFEAEAPDWFGDRVFGGIVVGQVITAAAQTVEPSRAPHSMHGYFLRPERPGSPVEISVERVRDGRTFSTRRVLVTQDGKELLQFMCSFHGDDAGDAYQLPLPAETPAPEDVEEGGEHEGPFPFDVREVGPTDPAADGTYASTRRAWVRCGAVGDDPLAHLAVTGYMSDWTGTSFRPLRMDDWGHTADASIDHAVWFHRPFRVDGWVFMDYQALVNHGGRAVVRGRYYTRDGDLCMSMAQELLIRPLET